MNSFRVLLATALVVQMLDVVERRALVRAAPGTLPCPSFVLHAVRRLCVLAAVNFAQRLVAVDLSRLVVALPLVGPGRAALPSPVTAAYPSPHS